MVGREVPEGEAKDEGSGEQRDERGVPRGVVASGVDSGKGVAGAGRGFAEGGWTAVKVGWRRNIACNRALKEILLHIWARVYGVRVDLTDAFGIGAKSEGRVAPYVHL